MSIRQFMADRPQIGWGLALAFMCMGIGLIVWNQLGGTSEMDRLSKMVTIRDAETGDTWEVPRGSLEKMLYERPLPLDPNVGITNPKTGKSTGFPIDAEWRRSVERVGAEREAQIKRKSGRSAPPPPSGGG